MAAIDETESEKVLRRSAEHFANKLEVFVRAIMDVNAVPYNTKIQKAREELVEALIKPYM